MKHNWNLKYENIQIRPLEIFDKEYLRNWRNDSNNTTYLRKIGYISQEQQDEWYANYLLNKDEIIFAIDETEKINHIVGSASIYNFVGSCAEFGRILIGDKEAHGKKIGLNATIAILSIAFNNLNLEKVICSCHRCNLKALNIYRKVGFNIIGEHVFNNDIEYEMEISKEEYFLLW